MRAFEKRRIASVTKNDHCHRRGDPSFIRNAPMEMKGLESFHLKFSLLAFNEKAPIQNQEKNVIPLTKMLLVKFFAV
jgi:hypothetical protein